MDRVLELLEELNEAKAALEEAEECGDLEERMELAFRVHELEILHAKACEAELA